MWELLQPVQCGHRLGFEISGTADTDTADPVVLDVLPHPLVGFNSGEYPVGSTAAADLRWTRRTP